VREEHAHTRCPQCGVIEACCEGICAQPASTAVFSVPLTGGRIRLAML